MSAINKSGKRFTPKIGQRARRVGGLLTPQSSQQLQTQSQTDTQTQTGTQTQTVGKQVLEAGHGEQKRHAIVSQIPPTQELTQPEPESEPEVKPKPTPTPNAELEPKAFAAVIESENEDSDDKLSDAEELKQMAPSAEKPNDEMFTQPLGLPQHRSRLNSLSIPTQITSSANLTGTLGMGSRRSSVVSNKAISRRNSVNNSSSISSVTGGERSRRGSIASLANTSRRGSLSAAIKPIFTGVSRSRRGSSVIAGAADLDEKPVSISISVMKSKKRRISVTSAPKKRKEVNVGGISVGDTIARNISTDKKIIQLPTTNGVKRKLQEDDREVSPTTALEPPKEETEPKKELEINKFESESKKKWMMNKDTERFELVDLEMYEQDEYLRSQYHIDKRIDNLRQVTQLKSKSDASLGESLRVNEDEMQMGDLCKPFLPFGRRSENYERAVEGEKKLLEGRAARKEIRKKARNLRMSIKDVMKLSENGNLVDESMNEKERQEKVKELMEMDREDANKGKGHNVPLLTIQDGKMTYSHESTVIDRHEDANLQMERVEENPFENIVTSNTYSKRVVTMKWTPHEVAELLKAVSIWGTDFGLIAQLFPHRTRKQIKAKFLLEEKTRPHLVEFALLRKLPVDIKEYSGKSGMEFKSLDEYNREIKEIKMKHEDEIKLMAEARDKAQAEDRVAQSELLGGGSGGGRRSRKAVLAEFRKNEEVVGIIDSNKS